MKRNKNDLKREFMGGGIRAMEGEGNENKFELSFSSEEPYERWFGTEILDHSEGAIDLTRLNEIGCLLFNHDVDRVIGKIEKAWIEDNRGKAIVEFDDDEFATMIRKKVENKTLKSTSIWYGVSNWESIAAKEKSKDGRFTGPAEIARSWVPYEVSIVTVPADPTVGVGRDLNIKEPLDFYERQIKINQNHTGGKK